MGIGAITLPTYGAQTAPTAKLPFVVGSKISATGRQMREHGVKDLVFLPTVGVRQDREDPELVKPIRLGAILLADGIDFQYHVANSTVLLNGPIAPSAAPTVTPTATRATAVLTFTGATNALARPAVNDQIQIGKGGGMGSGYVTWVDTLDTSGTLTQVVRGATADTCIANITALVNGTPGHGTTYWSGRMAAGEATPGFDTYERTEVSASQAYGVPSGTTATITFRALDWGSTGNSYVARVVTGTTISFPGTTMSGGTGATVTGTGPDAGDFTYAYAYWREADSCETAISATTEVSLGVNGDVSVAMTAAPSRNGTVVYRPFRTLVDGTKYFAGDDSGSSPYTDNDSDDALSGDFAIVHDDTIYRPYAAGYPERFLTGCWFKGSLFGAGAKVAADYSAGTATIASATTATVTINTGIVTTDMIGRLFRCTSTDQDDWLIVDVSESANTLTLNRAYGTARTTVAYRIRDARDPFEVRWATPLLPNAWPVGNSITGVTSPDPTGIVCMRSAWDSIVVWTRTGVWRLIGSPDAGFQVVPISEGMGAWGPRSVVDVEGTLYWLGPDGLYAWGGAGVPESLSKPEQSSPGVPRGIQGTVELVEADAAVNIVSVHDSATDTIRWYVPTSGSPWNNTQIIYDLQTGAFTSGTCEAVTAAASIYGADGESYLLTGDLFAGLWQMDVGTTDGWYGYEPKQAVGSYTAATQTITFSGTPAYPVAANDLGYPVCWVSATGDIYRGIVCQTSATGVRLVSPPTTAPAAGNQVAVGAIEGRLKSSKFDLGFSDGRKTLSSVRVSYTPITAGRLWCAGGVDAAPSVFNLRSSAAADFADLSNTDGEHLFCLRKGKGRRVQIELLTLQAGSSAEIHGVTPTIRLRQEQEA